MKKIIRVLFAVVMVACLVLTMTACKTDCDNGNHDLQLVSVDEATCTTAKVEHYKCINCDYTEDKTIGAALEHDYTGATWTASTTDATKHERTCTRTGCGYKDVQNHTPATDGGTPATCLTPGVTAATVCSDCNATIAAGTTIEQLGHDFDAKIEANVSDKVDATCTEDGHMTVKCSRCEVTELQTITKTGHSITYDITDETHTEKCSNCDYVGTAVTHTNTDGKCVCGSKLYTDFAVTDYATIKSSVPNNNDNSTEKFFAIGIVKSITDGYNTTVVMTDVNGAELQIYWVYNEDGSIRDQNPSKTYSVGDVVVYYGIANNYNGTVQLRNAWLVQLKADQLINMAGLAATTLDVPENVSENFTLPTIEGATVIWEVVDGTGITVSGNNATVTPSKDGEQTVELKATITVGTAVATKNYTVVVSKAGERTIILDFAADSDLMALISGTQGTQNFNYGVAGYQAGNSKLNTGYLMVYKDGFLANATAIPGSILKIEYIVTFGASANTDYYVTLSKTAGLAVNTTGSVVSHGKGDGVATTGSVTATEEDGFNYFNITVSAANGQLVKVIITYAECDHETTTEVAGTNATCTSAGTVAHKVCSTCGVMLNNDGEVLATVVGTPALGHNFGELTEAVAPTCSTTGHVAYYHCDRCEKDFNEAKTTEIVDVTIAIDENAHNYVYSVDPEDATKHIGVCEHNNEHKTESASHEATAWVTTGSEDHWKVCTICDARFDQAAHDFSNGACECGKTQDGVNYVIESRVEGYEGQDVVINDLNNEATTDATVTFTVEIPSNYTLVSVQLVIGEATPVELTATEETYSFAVTKEALGAETKVTVVVTVKASEKSWKVATADNLKDGAKIIIANVSSKSVAGTVSTTSTKYLLQKTGDSADMTNTSSEETPFGIADAQMFILERNGDNWAIKFSNLTDTYLVYGGSGNSVASGTIDSTGALWSIATDTNKTVITNVGYSTRILRYNTSSPRFACYTSGQADIQIYVWC